MTSLPEGRAGRMLAVAIAALAIALFYFVAVAPVLAFYDANALKLEDRRQTLLRYEAAARDLPTLRAQGQKLRDQGSDSGLLFSAPSDAVAAADVQSALKDLIEAGAAKLTSAQTLPAVAAGNLRRVGVRVSFSGDLKLLTGVLVGIDSSRPVLSVDALEVRGSGDDEGEKLSITMDIYGFRSAENVD